MGECVDLMDGLNGNVKDIEYSVFRYLLDIVNNINHPKHLGWELIREKLQGIKLKYEVHHHHKSFLVAVQSNKMYFRLKIPLNLYFLGTF